MFPGRLIEPEPLTNPKAGAEITEPTELAELAEYFEAPAPTSNIEPSVVILPRARLTPNELTPARVTWSESNANLSVNVGIAQRVETPREPTDTRLPSNVARMKLEF